MVKMETYQNGLDIKQKEKKERQEELKVPVTDRYDFVANSICYRRQ